MKLIVIMLLVLSCSEAPFKPPELTPEERTIDSLKVQLDSLRLNGRRWGYIARCNAEWFEENKIEPPCQGGI